MKSFATGLTGRIGFVALACTLVLGLLTAVPAGATTNASISGTVTAAVGGAPLQNICVFAVSTDGGGQSSTVTAVDGTYSLINLVPDTYIVDFYVQAGCAGGNYAEQWYNATNAGTIIKANATAVPLTSGLAQTGINASMVQGATITGTVTAAVGGAPLQNICVNAWGNFKGSAITAADGSFSITGLPDAYYTFEYDPTCTFTQSSPYADVLTTTLVHLSAGTSTNESYPLPLAGVIRGTVTSLESPGGVPGVCVGAYQTGSGAGIGFAITANDGTYSIGNLWGSYSVLFDPTCSSSISSPYQIDNFVGPTIVTASSFTTISPVIVANPGTFSNVISPSTNPGTGIVGGSYAASATATSGDPVSISLDAHSSGCVLSSGHVTFTAVGTCLVDFNDATSGSSPYVSAAQVQQSISISAMTTTPPPTTTTPTTTTTTTTTTTLPTTTTTTTTTLPVVRPQPLTLGFSANSSSISSKEKNSLGALAKKLKIGASITITAYAKNNGKLAKLRAEAVEKFLKSRKSLHATIKWISKTSSNKVSVVTTKQ